MYSRNNKIKHKIYSAIYIITLCLLLQSCGQKGALFLPESTQPTTPTTNPAPKLPENIIEE